MSTIGELAGHEMIWVQTNFSGPAYELRAAETVFASLRGCRGECGNHSWVFKLEGILRRRVTVRSSDSDVDVAVVRWHREQGGILDLPEGRTLRFGPAVGRSPERWEWLGPDGKALVHFKTRAGFDISEGLFEIEQEAAGLSELPLLVVLGEYLASLLAMRRVADSSATVAGAIDVWDSFGFAWPDFPDLPWLPDFD